MGIFSKLFGGNQDEPPAQLKSEQWQIDQPAAKNEWQGSFYDRYQACPDCHNGLLCDEHFVEMKARFDERQDPAPRSGFRLW